MTSKVDFRITVGVPVIDRISEAVKNGDEETFSELIAVFKYYESANLNQLDRVGSHPLHWAVKFRREKMLKTMLHYKKGLRLDVDITDADGVTALEIAFKNKNYQAFDQLVRHGCQGTYSSFEEWRGRLLSRSDDFSSSQHRKGFTESCKSEIITHHQQVYYYDNDSSNAASSRRHLLYPLSGTHWNEEVCKKAVQKCYHDLTNYMEATAIAPLLVESGHLALEKIDIILSHQTKQDRALQLLALLPRCGRSAYQGLFKALKKESEHKVHEELLQQLEHMCESILETWKESVSQMNHDELEENTIYCESPHALSAAERSLELSDRTESGIYSATPGAEPSTASSGRLSASSQKRSSSSQSWGRKRRSLVENPHVMAKGRVNHTACTNFKVLDEHPTRSPLKVINAVIKREQPPIQATCTSESNASDGTYLSVQAAQQQTSDRDTLRHQSTTPNLVESFEASSSPTESFLIISSEMEESDTIETDMSGKLIGSSPPTAPIDIPSRHSSFSSVQESDSGGARERLPQQPGKLCRQISRDIPSSDSNSSDSSFIKLSHPKYLSHGQLSWKRTFVKLFDRCRQAILSAEVQRSTSRQSDSFYVTGLGTKM